MIAVPILALLNTWLRALPNALDFTIARRPSLSNRIQLWVIVLILLSFVIIGWVTAWYFGQTSDYRLEVKIKEKIDAIVYGPLKQISGSVSAEHGIGLDKKRYISVSRSEDEVRIMQQIKSVIDPNGIMNPGKIFSD